MKDKVVETVIQENKIKNEKELVGCGKEWSKPFML